MEIPAVATVCIEVSRNGFVKPRAQGGVDFVSPLPAPFNYGSVPDTLAPDGDPLDAVVLGPRLATGTEVELPVRAVVRFVDDGQVDDKLICSAEPITPAEEQRVRRFFRFYGRAKTALNLARGKTGETAYRGYARCDEDDSWARWRAR